jgi:hypothetical protein
MMPASPQLKEARSDAEFWESQYKKMMELQAGLHEFLEILRIQRESGVMHYMDWPGSTKDYERDSYGNIKGGYKDGVMVTTWGSLEPLQMLQVAAIMHANMRSCKHETQEETGQSIPMGSFTARPTRCQRCGQKFHND